MNVILYMATTANGMIARENDETDFVSGTEWDSFRSMAKRTGNLVMGRRTYNIMVEDGDFEAIETDTVVIVSDRQVETENSDHLVASSPQDAIELLEERGFEEVMVAGGGRTGGRSIPGRNAPRNRERHPAVRRRRVRGRAGAGGHGEAGGRRDTASLPGRVMGINTPSINYL